MKSIIMMKKIIHCRTPTRRYWGYQQGKYQWQRERRANTNDSERGGLIPMTAREEGKYQWQREDQYKRIRKLDNIKVNIQHFHGPSTTKLTFLLFQDFHKYLCRQMRIGCTTIQQCKYCKFFEGATVNAQTERHYIITTTRLLCQLVMQR